MIRQTEECIHCNKNTSVGFIDQNTIHTKDDQEQPVVISTD